jgi:Zn-dependent protease with chaperone function
VPFSKIVATPVTAWAICETMWDGDQLVSRINGMPAHLSLPLRDKQERITSLTVGQVLAFSEAKDRISRVAGVSTRLVICDDAAPNAFAFSINNTDFVAVTPGMFKLANGDRDVAASVIGHELAIHGSIWRREPPETR